MAQAESIASTGNALVHDARRVFLEVQRALAEWVAAVPGELRRPADMQKALRLDSKICWQVFNVIRGENALSAARYVPTAAAMQRAIRAAEAAGVAEANSRAVLDSLAEFDAVVRVHAGSRADFAAMLSAVAPDESAEQVELQHRRAAYRALSHIWGAQQDVFGSTTIVRRSASGEHASDELLIGVKRGLRRLRPGGHELYGSRLATPGAEPQPLPTPLDPEAAQRYGAPLLPEFCTRPLPRFRTLSESGWQYCELVDDRLGRQGSVDLVFGTRADGLAFPRDVDGRRWFGLSALLRMPAALLINTLLVHRPSFGAVAPKHMVFAAVPGSDAPRHMARVSLPQRERVVPLGRADQLAQAPDLPGYGEMLAHACGRAGWELGEFDAFRVRISHPVLHAVSRLYFFVD